MSTARTSLLVFAAIYCCYLQVARCEVVIEIKFQNYSDTCREDAKTSKCDPKFRFCLDRPRDRASLSSCYYATTRQSQHFQDTNHLDFNYMSDIRGIPNPWQVRAPALMEGQVMLVIQIHDDDLFTPDDHMQTWGVIFLVRSFPSRREAPWTSIRTSSSSHWLSFQYRVYCVQDYYGPNCSQFCRSADNEAAGHYSCEPASGSQLCLPGWTGFECREDVDECLLSFCERGSCVNMQGDYLCHCPQRYTGKNCSHRESACSRNPCSNKAACVDTDVGSFYSCSCVDGWQGAHCDVKANVCVSEPCLNGAKCLPSPEHGNFTCLCAPLFSGTYCEDYTLGSADNTTDNSTDITTDVRTDKVTTVKLTTSPMTAGVVPSLTQTEATVASPLFSPKPLFATVTRESTAETLNKPGEQAGQTNVEKSVNSGDDETGIPYWQGILIALLVLACVIIVLCLVLQRRRRQQKLLADYTVVFENNNKMAFENNIYSEVNRLSAGADNQKQHTPLPSIPTESEQVTSPKMTSGGSEPQVQGAEGGTYSDVDIDMDIDGYVKPSEKNKLHSDGSEKMSGSEQGASNFYCDFNKLKSSPFKQDSVEDVHYHDLDEMALAFRDFNESVKDKNATLPVRAKDLTLPVRSLPVPVRKVQAVPGPGPGVDTTYNDIPRNTPVVFDKLGIDDKPSPSGVTSDDKPSPSSVTSDAKPSPSSVLFDNLFDDADLNTGHVYSELSKRGSSDSAEEVTTLGNCHQEEQPCQTKLTKTDNPWIPVLSSDQSESPALSSASDEYSTPRSSQNSYTQQEVVESQYDTPPSNLPAAVQYDIPPCSAFSSSKILANGHLNFQQPGTKSFNRILQPPTRFRTNDSPASGTNQSEHTRQGSMDSLPPAPPVPHRPAVEHYVNASPSESGVVEYLSPLSVKEGDMLAKVDKHSDGDTAWKEFEASQLRQVDETSPRLYLGIRDSSNT